MLIKLLVKDVKINSLLPMVDVKKINHVSKDKTIVVNVM